ncbi:Lsr2 protein [Actinomadura madurae]|uniref:Lsr2 protein n=1 Tax=Actinomadura madurae TaxID=1993 RepID=A0A1I5I4L3_9ACTN|nr:Lsr2 protein [Actinomadura madurae]
MAQQVRVTMTGDLDGSEASETVSFAVDGREYEIDLNEKNVSKLRSSLHAYMESGRRLKELGAERLHPTRALVAVNAPLRSASGRRTTASRSAIVAAFRLT